MHRLLHAALRHRRWTLVVLALVTVVAGLVLTRARMGTSLGDMVLGNMPEYQRAQEWSATMGGDLVLVIALEDAGADDPRLAQIVDRLQRLPQTRFVIAPINVPDTFASSSMIAPAGHVLLEVNCHDGDAETLEKAPAFIEDVRAICEEAGFASSAVHFGGLIALLAAIQEQTIESLLVQGPLCVVVMIVMSWILLRRIWPLVLMLVVGQIAVIWMAGFAIALDPQINALIAIAPALMFLIAFADVVHLSCAHERCVRTECDSDAAVRTSATEVGRACMFTSITTIIGFSGMFLIDMPSMQRMGLVMGFGVAAALVLALMLTSLTLQWRPTLRLGERRRMERIATNISAPALRWPRRCLAVCAVVAIFAAWGASRITVETDLAQRITAESTFRQDLAFLEEHFGGLGLIELQIEWDASHRAEDLAGPARALAADLRTQPGVLRVISLLEYADALPASAVRSPVVRSYLDSEAGRARMIVQIQSTAMMQARVLGDQCAADARAIFGPGIQVHPAGPMYLAGLWLDRHVVSEGRALIATFALIAMVMMVLFRSWRVGLAAMIPNMFPLLVLGGVLGWMYDAVDSDMAIVAFLAIGLAVDDTIHMVSRMQLASRNGAGRDEAIGRAMQDAGRGVVVTSVVFAAGLLPLALSDYQSLRDLGLLLPVTMLAALAADVLLLPAIVKLGLLPLPGSDVVTES